jgi:hypothetical protein
MYSVDLRGRYLRMGVKQVAERCLRLPTGSLRDALSAGGPVEGTLSWPAGGAVPGASMKFTVEPLGDDRCLLTLRYALGDSPDAQDVEEAITMVASPQPFGGRRWAFLCPLEQEGYACGRTASVLYLPPGRRYFGCRHCHELTYASRLQRRDSARTQDLPGSADQQEPDGSAAPMPGGLVEAAPADPLLAAACV